MMMMMMMIMVGWLILFLLGDAISMVSSLTLAADVAALEQVKASIDPSSIMASSCLASWDFLEDPCDRAGTEVFTCGLRCDDNGGGPSRRVTSLSLGSSQLAGKLSPALGNLTALRFLDMSGNAFSGGVPATLGLLVLLERLDLSRNALDGPIPNSLGNLPQLAYLSLAHNKLEGAMPASFSGLISLQTLLLDGNNISGAVSEVLSGLPRLTVLHADSNQLSGELPASLPASLIQLILSNNRISGSLSIARLTQLSVLDLRSNLISGTLNLSMLFSLPYLQQVNLSYNRLSGLLLPTLPPPGSQLTALDLGFNQMGGKLLPALASLPHLSALSLRYNLFHGGIPVEYASKPASQGNSALPFTRLYLDGNFLSGVLPMLFRKSSSLISARFDGNCLRDCPPNLPFCQGGQRPMSQCASVRP